MTFLLIFIIGLFFGSFFGVLVDRIPKGEGIVSGRSHCDFCKKELMWYDLIPLFSYISTKGKCRYCHKALPLFYPIIEITTGLMFVLTYIFLIHNSEFIIQNLVYYLFIISSFIVIFFIDYKYGIIPDKIVSLSVVVSFVYLLFINHQSSIINHLLSAIGAFLFFLLVSIAFYLLTKKQGMGGGDIKLSFLLGLILGFPNILVCLYLAFLTGTIASIILILWRKKNFRKDSLPFGPFLILGAFISLFWGNLLYLQALRLLGV